MDVLIDKEYHVTCTIDVLDNDMYKGSLMPTQKFFKLSVFSVILTNLLFEYAYPYVGFKSSLELVL